MDASIDGTTWRASSAVAFQYVGGSLTSSYPFNAQNRGACEITRSPSGWFASPFAGQGSGDVGLTTLTATRVTGNFRCTAPPAAATGATGTLTLTQGAFDITR